MDRLRKISVVVALFVVSGFSYAQCLGLVSGPVLVDVKSCKIVDPKTDFSKEINLGAINALNEPAKSKFYQSYRGFVIQSLVVKSDATKKDFDKRKGALGGESIRAFVPSGTIASCEAMKGQRIKAQVQEYCCNGGADAPCLLSTTYILNQAQVVGKAASSAGDKERQQTESSAEYKAAMDLYRKEDYAGAAKKLESLGDKLDLRGHYMIGVLYRKLDQCDKAVPYLQEVFDRSAKKDTWADQETIVRKSNFLLARCLAKTQQAGRAAIILSAYLIEPKKYKSEIQQSLKHPDFGWINPYREYNDYRKAARQKLNEIGAND